MVFWDILCEQTPEIYITGRDFAFSRYCPFDLYSRRLHFIYTEGYSDSLASLTNNHYSWVTTTDRIDDPF